MGFNCVARAVVRTFQGAVLHAETLPAGCAGCGRSAAGRFLPLARLPGQARFTPGAAAVQQLPGVSSEAVLCQLLSTRRTLVPLRSECCGGFPAAARAAGGGRSVAKRGPVAPSVGLASTGLAYPGFPRLWSQPRHSCRRACAQRVV